MQFLRGYLYVYFAVGFTVLIKKSGIEFAANVYFSSFFFLQPSFDFLVLRTNRRSIFYTPAETSK